MKVLIVLGHPDVAGHSFNHALKSKAVEALEKAGHEVKVNDLYNMEAFNKSFIGAGDFKVVENKDNFKPQVEQGKGHLIDDILEEQKKVDWCDHLIFIFPIYWISMPAILHSYFERVFTAGWGYKFPNVFNNGTFKGKRAMCVVTTGAPPNMYSKSGCMGSIDASLFHITHGCFYFCGFDTLKSCFYYSPAHVGDEGRKKYLEEFGDVVTNLDKREKIPYKAFEGYDANTQCLTNPEDPNEIDLSMV